MLGNSYGEAGGEIQFEGCGEGVRQPQCRAALPSYG